jgi:predicted flap endonuclease-1-like 5' DNA nuclease
MRAIKVFFLGLVFGWLVKWIIDDIFNEDHLRIITNENALLQERIKVLEAPKSLETKSVQRTAAEPQPAERPRPQPAPRPEPAPHSSRKDDLKLIKGVGPAMEKKLNAAGIRTFEQLSRLTTMDLQNILGISKRVTQSADNLLTQARKFAQQNSMS